MSKKSVALNGEILKKFGFTEKVSYKAFGGGHINDTYLVSEGDKSLVLQRINQSVFPNPADIMDNIDKVTSFIKKKVAARGGDTEREVLQLVKTTDNELYALVEGNYWRATKLIENTTAYETVTSADMLEKAGYAFGDFQNLLSGFPAESLHEIIKDFHYTPARFNQLVEAIENDKAERVWAVPEEIKFALDREEDCKYLVELLEKGELPLKVTHNDTKMSNILIDIDTDDAVCVIDLDTIMPGLTAYDFGDSIRAGASTAAEDETDLSKVNFDLNLFEAYTKGFLRAAGNALTDTEIKTLPIGAKMMTFEVGMRFLADYLNGDVYFKTAYEDHNLARARNQFKLVQDMEENMDKMLEIVNKYVNREDKMRVAIIGAWHVHAGEYAESIKKNPKSELVCCWDSNQGRGENFAKSMDIPFISDINEIWNDPSIDSIVITTATAEHPEILLNAAKSGKNIFTEKVLTLTDDDAQKAAKAIEDSGKVFTISFPHKRTSFMLAAKEIIDSGILGKLTYVRVRNAHNGSSADWLPSHFYDQNETGGGAMIDLGAHPMYLLNWLLGEPKSVVSIYTDVTNRGVEDNAVSLIEFEGGSIGVSETGFLSSHNPNYLEVSGLTGTLLIRDNVVSYNSLTSTDDKWVIVSNLPEELPLPIDQWVDSVVDGAAVRYGLDEAVALTKLMTGAYTSYKTGEKYIFD